jgi:putative membrane protein
MFGTGAGVIIDITFLVSLLAPVVALASIRLAGRRRFDPHRRLQIGLLVVCVLAVLALELRIRLAGGSGALIDGSGFPYPRFNRAVLSVHMTGAVVTYVAWTWLAVVSHRRYRGALPGSFSHRHRRTGWFVFAGLAFTAVSAAAVYALTFVL